MSNQSSACCRVVQQLEEILGEKSSQDYRLVPSIRKRISGFRVGGTTTIEVSFGEVPGDKKRYLIEVMVHWGSCSGTCNALDAVELSRLYEEVSGLAIRCFGVVHGHSWPVKHAEGTWDTLVRMRELEGADDR